MTFEKFNIMSDHKDDDYGRIITPGESDPEMPSEDEVNEDPEIGEDPGLQIETPEPDKKEQKIPPPPPEKIEEIIKPKRKPKLPS